MRDATRRDIGNDLGLLCLRLTTGGYLAAHGAQKLFGAFGGHGIDGTSGMMESLGLRPGQQHATLAGATELGSGVLTLAGAVSPLGPVAMMGPMGVAAGTAHRGKGPFVTSGGWELPATNLAIAAGLALAGPGRLSVDGLLGIRLPRWIGVAALAGVAAAIAMTITRAIQASRRTEEQSRQEQATVEVAGQAAERDAAEREPAEWHADRALAEQAASTGA